MQTKCLITYNNDFVGIAGSVLNCLRNHYSDTESCTTTNVRQASQLSTKHTGKHKL